MFSKRCEGIEYTVTHTCIHVALTEHLFYLNTCTCTLFPPPFLSLSLPPSLLSLPQSVLMLYDMDGKVLTNFPLEMGSVTGYSGKRNQSEIFYRFMSFLTPGMIYHCDLKTYPLKPKVCPGTMM